MMEEIAESRENYRLSSSHWQPLTYSEESCVVFVLAARDTLKIHAKSYTLHYQYFLEFVSGTFKLLWDDPRFLRQKRV